MTWRLLADLVLAVHALFVVFVILGGMAVLRWPALAWVHLPAVAWGVATEFGGWICPLTPLEVALRQRGGDSRGQLVAVEVVPDVEQEEATGLKHAADLSVGVWPVGEEHRAELAGDEVEARVGEG